jgi:hypothetical protein
MEDEVVVERWVVERWPAERGRWRAWAVVAGMVAVVVWALGYGLTGVAWASGPTCSGVYVDGSGPTVYGSCTGTTGDEYVLLVAIHGGAEDGFVGLVGFSVDGPIGWPVSVAPDLAAANAGLTSGTGYRGPALALGDLADVQANTSDVGNVSFGSGPVVDPIVAAFDPTQLVTWVGMGAGAVASVLLLSLGVAVLVKYLRKAGGAAGGGGSAGEWFGDTYVGDGQAYSIADFDRGGFDESGEWRWRD